jgi:hypothetical protein
VGVTFVDETTGAELTGCAGSIVPGGCTFASTAPGAPFTSNGIAYRQFTLNGLGVNLAALPTGTDFQDVGVRVSAGSAIGSCAGSGTNDYGCFDLTSGDGPTLLLSYSASQNTNAPTLTGITPTSTCATGASPFFSDSSGGTTCAVSLTATADFPTGATAKQVTAKITNNGNNFGTCALTNTTGNTWSGNCAPAVPVDANQASSEYNVELDYSYKKGGNTVSDCFAKLKKGCLTVARFTSATDADDGPLKDLLVSVSSAPAGTAATVNVTITVTATGVTNKLQFLRAAGNGSATAYFLGVPDTGNGTKDVETGIINGCTDTFSIYKPPVGACPDVTTPFPDCATNKPSNASGNPFGRAFNTRFNCGDPTKESKNLWPNFSTPGDKRAVTLVITTYNAYSNGSKPNGKQDYPVIGFGAFYVTGFDGSNCKQQPAAFGEEPPPPGDSGKGDVWGYFIKFSRQGDIPSGQACSLNDFSQCMAVLTR